MNAARNITIMMTDVICDESGPCFKALNAQRRAASKMTAAIEKRTKPKTIVAIFWPFFCAFKCRVCFSVRRPLRLALKSASSKW